MHLVVAHRWQKEASEVACIIAEAMRTIAYEAQQKIAAGGPAVLASFADPTQAEALAETLYSEGVPAFVVDTVDMRTSGKIFSAHRFQFGEGFLQLESADGDRCDIAYSTIDLLLVATRSVGQTDTVETVTRRKISLGKAVLSGGLLVTKIEKEKESVVTSERDETLCLYAQDQTTVVFSRAGLSFEGFGEDIRLTRELNFNFLKSELRRLAPEARYDDRLLKRAALIRLLGPSLNPDTDLDLGFNILARSLRTHLES